jgi:hypothetical protein
MKDTEPYDNVGPVASKSRPAKNRDTNILKKMIREDPEFRCVIAAIQSGVKVDPRHIEKTNPRLGNKLKSLLDLGILNLQH